MDLILFEADALGIRSLRAVAEPARGRIHIEAGGTSAQARALSLLLWQSFPISWLVSVEAVEVGP